MRLIHKTATVLTLSFFFSACELVDVSELQPVNQLSENAAITTVGQAQSVLLGTYGQLKTGLEMIVYYPGTCALMGGTMEPGTSGGASEASYHNNDPSSEDYVLEAIYTKSYKIINNANHIIEKAPLIATQDPRREGIIAEAKFLRALSHFYLLRLYGQFYDLNSPYGVVLKDKPITEASSQQRATVQQTYDFILADLDYAIAKGPDFTRTFYASRQAAMALKAKVLLYAKKYGEAAEMASQAIHSGSFSLETKFSDIFSKKIVGTREVLFQTPYDDKNDRNNKAFMFRSAYLPSAAYAALLLGDNRDTAALVRNANGTLRNKKFNNTVFNGQSLTADTEYFLRLGELYLVWAEALVRSGAPLDDARDALNTIRSRAQMPEVTAGTKEGLLEAIRQEKMLELGAESGEEWFDMVRYATEGDLDISAIRPGVTSPARYILPLPFKTVQLSNGVLEQNPGY